LFLGGCFMISRWRRLLVSWRDASWRASRYAPAVRRI